MIKNYPFSVFLLCITFIGLVSCSKDEDNNEEFDGSREAIEEFLTPEITQKLENFGLNIHTGSNPPDVTGSYMANNLEVINTDVPGDQIGNIISDISFSFLNQNNSDLSIEYIAQGASQSDEGSGSLLSGDDNSFTVFLKAKSTIGSYTAQTFFVISGKMAADRTGIRDYQIAGGVIDDGDAPEGIFIPEGSARVAEDKDDLAERTN